MELESACYDGARWESKWSAKKDLFKRDAAREKRQTLVSNRLALRASMPECGHLWRPCSGSIFGQQQRIRQNEAIGWFYTCVMGMVTTREAHRTPTIPSDFRVSGRL